MSNLYEVPNPYYAEGMYLRGLENPKLLHVGTWSYSGKDYLKIWSVDTSPSRRKSLICCVPDIFSEEEIKVLLSLTKKAYNKGYQDGQASKISEIKSVLGIEEQ